MEQVQTHLGDVPGDEPREPQAPTRDCLGCEGAGQVAGFRNVDPLFRKSGDRFTKPCPVCLGSGFVEAKPSVRDAVTDAETLLNVTRDRHRSVSQFHATHKGWITGADAAFNLRYPAFGGAEQAIGQARTAARFIFRAVPGLRGDR